MAEALQDLKGKVAIVTGAAGGIGTATARRLAQGGARVVLSDLPSSPLSQVVSALKGEGLDVAGQASDIADEASVKSLIDFTVRTYGRLDVLDNNAARQGLANDTDVMSMPLDVWDSVMAVNARGTMLMCKHALPVMIANGGGSIINISSGTSVAGDIFSTAYAVSKGAINTLTRYVATQYGSKNIRCNALILGLVSSPKMEQTLPAPIKEIFKANKLSGRLGKPEDVAEMVAFLGSDRTPWLTGQLLPLDGGFYAHTPTFVPVAQLMAQVGK
jgi:NAD(P)-dependent dehydrogenase (short-subunit alcohol dehydrogenase family)